MPLISDAAEFWVTLAILVASCVAIGLLSWLERRPRTSLTPRMIPTTPLMLIFGFIGLLALVHLANLSGIQTGR